MKNKINKNQEKPQKIKAKAIGEIPEAKSSVGAGVGILSFLLPIVGVVKAKNNIEKDPGRANVLLNISIVSVAISMALPIISFIASNKTVNK